MNLRRVLLGMLNRSYFLFPDKLFLQMRFYLEMGKKLSLRNPQTMNEKLQWLKLYNRKPEYTMMVDKILVKDYVSGLIGPEHVVPTIAVWDSPEEIDFGSLPDKFVLKTNHSGGNTGVILCKDKNSFATQEALVRLKKSLRSNIYKLYREWPYKDVCKRVFAEELLEDEEGINDYKFYCFDGHVDSVLVCVDRQIGQPKFYFFDENWKLRRYNKRGKEAPEDFTLPKPLNVDRMFEIARMLSKGIPFVRVDLYNVNGKIYFGELTFFPASGFDANRLPEADLYFGGLIRITT